MALASGGQFNLLARYANEQGATELGVLPDTLPGGRESNQTGLNTHEILQAAAEGKLKALWLAGCDPFALHPDRTLVEKALEKVDFLAVQDIAESEATHYASVVLPMAAPAEQDGTFTNAERRVQRMRQVIPSLGEAKPAWRIYADVMLRLGMGKPPFSSEEVMEEIGRAAPTYAGCAYESLSEEGDLLG
jgi:predicted molibdopterin-dependent oxidoreductase YjgC